MSFQPSQHSYRQGISGTSADQWIKPLYPQPEAEDNEQAEHSKAEQPQLLEAPSPFTTVALVSAKEGMDHFGQMEMPEKAIPKAVDIVISVGHVALGVGLFGVLLWGATTIGAAIGAQATKRPGQTAKGERDEEAAS